MEARFSFTTKVNGDLLTVRGDTAEEFKTNITSLNTDLELQQAISTLHTAANGGK